MYTIEKGCLKCGVTKPLSEFYRHPDAADGHLNKCKACTKKDVAKHRLENIERIREYDRDRAKLQHRKLHRNKRVINWKKTFPSRMAAHAVVRRAILNGALIKQPCLICGKKAHAHHPDYDRPLDVIWLCAAHHSAIHKTTLGSNNEFHS